jgi:ABC-2 type transport system ATP-binding protein
MNVIESTALGKRYRRTWALRDCTLGIPGGHIVTLVGPNGAGKTTLLTMATGLTRPTEGSVTVLGGMPAGSPDALEGVAFVAQDAPLYRNLPVADMLREARSLNRCWDQRRADDRLDRLGTPPRQQVGKLSGGQQAQLALTIALARRPACWCSTSRWRRSTRWRGTTSWPRWSRRPATTTSRSCSPRTCWPSSSGSPAT